MRKTAKSQSVRAKNEAAHLRSEQLDYRNHMMLVNNSSSKEVQTWPLKLSLVLLVLCLLADSGLPDQIATIFFAFTIPLALINLVLAERTSRMGLCIVDKMLLDPDSAESSDFSQFDFQIKVSDYLEALNICFSISGLLWLLIALF